MKKAEGAPSGFFACLTHHFVAIAQIFQFEWAFTKLLLLSGVFIWSQVPPLQY